MKVQYVLYTNVPKPRIRPTTITFRYTFKYSRVMTEKNLLQLKLERLYNKWVLTSTIDPIPIISNVASTVVGAIRIIAPCVTVTFVFIFTTFVNVLNKMDNGG